MKSQSSEIAFQSNVGSNKVFLASHLLPWHHPRLDCWHQHTSQKNLHGVVDEQGYRYQREVLVACKHYLQHWDSWCTQNIEISEANSVCYQIQDILHPNGNCGIDHYPICPRVYSQNWKGRVSIDSSNRFTFFSLQKALSSTQNRLKLKRWSVFRAPVTLTAN